MLKRATVVLMVAATALTGACATSSARSSAAVPLDVPEPPPRQPISPVSAVVAEEPQPSAPAPVPAARTGAPPAAVSPVATTPEPAHQTLAPELRPAGSAGGRPTGALVLAFLGRTKQKLDLIDRRRLNAGKSADYDAARRFLAQAEAAVKADNLMLAQSSAEKADALANGLR